jgi:hypothetical protein
MNIDKKQAVRQAAAKYSTNPPAAFVEYGQLTGQIDQSFSFKEPNREYWEVVYKISREMLELLPKYRHPAADIFSESMIFIDPNSMQIKAKMHQEPEFLMQLKKRDYLPLLLKRLKNMLESPKWPNLIFGSVNTN